MEIAEPNDRDRPDRSFFLRGTIDRVDRLGPDTYRILDYKTGSAFDYEELVEFGRGQKIQHALYAVALERMLVRKAGRRDGPGSPGADISFRPGAARDWRSWSRISTGTASGGSSAISWPPQNGYFIAGPEAKCTYCDYRPVCGAGAPKRSGRKREGSPEVLEAYDRLGEYK